MSALLELLSRLEPMEADISATAPEHVIGVRAGHRQLKERMIAEIREMMGENP